MAINQKEQDKKNEEEILNVIAKLAEHYEMGKWNWYRFREPSKEGASRLDAIITMDDVIAFFVEVKARLNNNYNDRKGWAIDQSKYEVGKRIAKELDSEFIIGYAFKDAYLWWQWSKKLDEVKKEGKIWDDRDKHLDDVYDLPVSEAEIYRVNTISITRTSRIPKREMRGQAQGND